MLQTFKGLALAAAITLTGGLATGEAAAQGRITLGTNPQGSLYYTIGGGMAAALQEGLGRQVTVQPFSGSSVYLPLISAGEVTLGLNSAIDTGGWYRGDEGGAPLSNLRVAARLWPLRQAFVVRADSGLTNVTDLAGQRTVTEFAALSGVSRVNVATIKAVGLSVDDVEPVTVSGLAAGLERLTEGQLDATSAAIGIPLVQQADAAIPGGVRYLSLQDPTAAEAYFDETIPGVYTLTVAPNPAMPEITEPVTISAYDIFLTVSADTPADQVQAILAALYDAFPQLQQDYPPLRGGDRDRMAASTNTAPYHPGAVAFYEERGMWTEANTTKDASLAN